MAMAGAAARPKRVAFAVPRAEHEDPPVVARGRSGGCDTAAAVGPGEGRGRGRRRPRRTAAARRAQAARAAVRAAALLVRGLHSLSTHRGCHVPTHLRCLVLDAAKAAGPEHGVAPRAMARPRPRAAEGHEHPRVAAPGLLPRPPLLHVPAEHERQGAHLHDAGHDALTGVPAEQEHLARDGRIIPDEQERLARDSDPAPALIAALQAMAVASCRRAGLDPGVVLHAQARPRPLAAEGHEHPHVAAPVLLLGPPVLQVSAEHEQQGAHLHYGGHDAIPAPWYSRRVPAEQEHLPPDGRLVPDEQEQLARDPDPVDGNCEADRTIIEDGNRGSSLRQPCLGFSAHVAPGAAASCSGLTAGISTPEAVVEDVKCANPACGFIAQVARAVQGNRRARRAVDKPLYCCGRCQMSHLHGEPQCHDMELCRFRVFGNSQLGRDFLWSFPVELHDEMPGIFCQIRPELSSTVPPPANVTGTVAVEAEEEEEEIAFDPFG